MARRFETQYRTRRNDNLGDPEWHNRRWDDIDRRMHARELDATKIDDAVDDLEAAALARLNDELTPIIAQAITRLQEFGLMFSATSHTERTIQTGNMQFVIDEDVRESFVATGFLILRPTADLTKGMSVRTLSYDNVTGVLTVESYSILGSGTYDDWSIGVIGDPDLAHATRTDNPHQTTAAQVGAYTEAEADDAIAVAVAAEATARTSSISAASAAIISGAPPTLDNIDKLAAALADDPTFATTIANELVNRLRFDQAQTLSQAQKDMALLNLGAWKTGDAKLSMRGVSDAGWVVMNDGTIGNQYSSASTRANADCQALFEAIWNTVQDAWAPVIGGRGASAAADWTANKRITLTRQCGRALMIAGAGSGLTQRYLGQYLGNETHTQSANELSYHAHMGHMNFLETNGGVSGNYLTTGGDLGWYATGLYSTTQYAGASWPMDVMNPMAVWYIHIKL